MLYLNFCHSPFTFEVFLKGQKSEKEEFPYTVRRFISKLIHNRSYNGIIFRYLTVAEDGDGMGLHIIAYVVLDVQNHIFPRTVNTVSISIHFSKLD